MARAPRVELNPLHHTAVETRGNTWHQSSATLSYRCSEPQTFGACVKNAKSAVLDEVRDTLEPHVVCEAFPFREPRWSASRSESCETFQTESAPAGDKE
jgi:hypothetical protein